MDTDLILALYSRPETIFTVTEIAQIMPDISSESLRDRLYYFTRVGKLIRLHHGIYAKQDYNLYELANKTYPLFSLELPKRRKEYKNRNFQKSLKSRLYA